MEPWILSVTETGDLRRAHDAYPDCSLYRREDLIALVYRNAQDRERWHLMLSVARNERDLEIADVTDAITALLPNLQLEGCVVEFGTVRDAWGDTRCFRVSGTERPVKRITQ